MAPLLPRRAVHASLRVLGPAVHSEHLPLRVRRAITDRAALVGSRPRSVDCSGRVLNGVSGEWVGSGSSTSAGSLLYLHGGGYVLGSSASHRNLVAHLVKQVGAPAFVPNYRLAPEHRWPAALDDAVAAYLALLQQRPGEPVAVIGTRRAVASRSRWPWPCATEAPLRQRSSP